jgi:phage tail-like protein
MATYYPPVAFYYSVKFTGISDDEQDSQFQSLSGLTVDMQIESIKEGGENRFEHVIPVRTKYSNLVLKRGIVKDTKLVKWFVDTFQNLTVKPADLTITLLNNEQQPLITWNIVQAWPKKWAVEDLSAMESKLLIESLEMQYQYFTIL